MSCVSASIAGCAPSHHWSPAPSVVGQQNQASHGGRWHRNEVSKTGPVVGHRRYPNLGRRSRQPNPTEELDNRDHHSTVAASCPTQGSTTYRQGGRQGRGPIPSPAHRNEKGKCGVKALNRQTRDTWRYCQRPRFARGSRSSRLVLGRRRTNGTSGYCARDLRRPAPSEPKGGNHRGCLADRARQSGSDRTGRVCGKLGSAGRSGDCDWKPLPYSGRTTDEGSKDHRSWPEL